MGNSLQDQFLKAGLIDKKKAHQTNKAKQKQTKLQQKQGKSESNEAKLAAEKAQAEKIERDRQLNQQRKLEAEQKAIAAQINQLIEMNRLDCSEGEIAYSFTDGTTIKQIHVTKAQQQQLIHGRLAIARNSERYELVPKGVAEKIALRDAALVILIAPSQPVPDEDDPYAEFQVPDDLMW